MRDNPGDGTTASICNISPSDQAGQVDNLVTRIEKLEQTVAELVAADISANQLSDLSQQAGWITGVTYLGTEGWTQTPAGTLIPPTGLALTTLINGFGVGVQSSGFAGGAVGIDGIKYVYGGYLTDIASGGTHYLHVSSALSSLAELGDTTLAAGDVHNSTYTGWRTTDDAAANFIVIADVEIIAGTAPPSSGWVTLSLQRTRVVGTIHTNFSHGSCEFPVGTFGGDDANSFSLIGYTKLNNLVAEGFQFSIKNNTDGDVQINSLLCTFIKVS